MSGTTPVLIYDGDCGICREWVNYWLGLTGERVVYRSYQAALTDYPQLSAADCRRSIQYIDSDGRIHSGAAATFRVLQRAGRPLGWWCYRGLPGFAWLAERVYNGCARRRGLLRLLTHALWGRWRTPARYDHVQWWFLRGLGLIYVFAFASAGVQITGLVGTDGLLPVSEFLDQQHGYYGTGAWYHAPTLLWLAHNDLALQLLCLAGALSGLAIVANRLTTPALAAAFALYLSVVQGGQDFFHFQWDFLLLEAGFLAIFVNAWPNLIRWLYRWLLFRYVFMAGFAKLASGDSTWTGLTALSHHFATQPLPTPLAWYAHQLPADLLQAATAATLLIEIVLVFLVFAPRRPRMLFAWLLILFQIAIALTGNYNFFNLLTLLLTLWLFDDAALAHTRGWPAAYRNIQPLQAGLCLLLAVLVVLAGVNQMSRHYRQQVIPVAQTIDQALAPFHIVNPYGLFANMTTRRPEIVIEGSRDGETWRAYEFPYKPGDPARAPGWNIPHQPRLDWQLWFAALSRADRQRWFEPLLAGLLENRPPITALLADNPFPETGPRYIRARLFNYRFTDFKTADDNGRWWRRDYRGDYYPSATLADIRNRSRGGLPLR